MQDFIGVPAVVDIASLRAEVKNRLWHFPAINPSICFTKNYRKFIARNRHQKTAGHSAWAQAFLFPDLATLAQLSLSV